MQRSIVSKRFTVASVRGGIAARSDVRPAHCQVIHPSPCRLMW
jgi:hypothetical protein